MLPTVSGGDSENSTNIDMSGIKRRLDIPKRQMSMEEKEEFVQNLGFDRKKVLMACLFSLLTTQTLFLNVENILPTYIPIKHSGLTSINTALILRYVYYIKSDINSCFELSALIFSPFIGKYLDRIGRKNAIIIGDIILVSFYKTFNSISLDRSRQLSVWVQPSFSSMIQHFS